MKLPSIKILLCWPSRMQIYGFVEKRTFLEQFVRMGVPAQLSNLGVPAQFSKSGGTSTIFQSGGTSTIFSTLHGSLWLGKDKGSIMKSAESGGTIHLEINFSSKVYSKSLLKVGSLKGSIVYPLILDYQFYTCVMQISSVPQLRVIHMERLYGYK